jgi:hypothetical protein
MRQLKSIIAPIHYVRFKFLFKKNLEKSRRYFSVLLALQSAKKVGPSKIIMSESEIGSVLSKLQKRRQTIELGKRIDQISSAG